MKLTKQDAQHFFDLMWPLQFFVNQQLKIHKNVGSLEEYMQCSTEEKLQVRNALYQNGPLIDLYLQENPNDCSSEDLSVVSGWKNHVEGNFHIERFLKKYSILIQNEDVYAVLGLFDGLDEMIHRSNLPLLVKTVLLPFKGVIVYDGLFQTYNVFFGGGIKRELKESYMIAKQNNRIIENLDRSESVSNKKESQPSQKKWTTELNELATLAKQLRSTSDSAAIRSPAFSLVKASIEYAQVVEANPEDSKQLYDSLKKVERAFHKSITTLERQDFW